MRVAFRDVKVKVRAGRAPAVFRQSQLVALFHHVPRLVGYPGLVGDRALDHVSIEADHSASEPKQAATDPSDAVTSARRRNPGLAQT